MANDYFAGGLEIRIEVSGGRTIRRRLEGVMKRHADLGPALREIAADFLKHMEDVFASEGAATRGGAWVPLSPAYAKWKTKHFPGRSKLILEDKLHAALVGKGKGTIRRIGRNNLTMGAAVRTPNGKWDLGLIHQEGTTDGRIPRRQIIDIPDPVVGRWLGMVRRHVSWE